MCVCGNIPFSFVAPLYPSYLCYLCFLPFGSRIKSKHDAERVILPYCRHLKESATEYRGYAPQTEIRNCLRNPIRGSQKQKKKEQQKQTKTTTKKDYFLGMTREDPTLKCIRTVMLSDYAWAVFLFFCKLLKLLFPRSNHCERKSYCAISLNWIHA